MYVEKNISEDFIEVNTNKKKTFRMKRVTQSTKDCPKDKLVVKVMDKREQLAKRANYEQSGVTYEGGDNEEEDLDQQFNENTQY